MLLLVEYQSKNKCHISFNIHIKYYIIVLKINCLIYYESKSLTLEKSLNNNYLYIIKRK